MMDSLTYLGIGTIITITHKKDSVTFVGVLRRVNLLCIKRSSHFTSLVSCVISTEGLTYTLEVGLVTTDNPSGDY